LPDYYFFLSYARGDDRDSIEKFFQDLSIEVRSHAGLAPDTPVGFLDVHVDVGTPWSHALMQALGQCQTFIALISPRYLLSEPCGREWAVFADRLRGLERGVADLPALLPLLWLPPQQLPEVVAARQYRNHHMPDAYDRTGLRQIIRLQRHHDDYLDLVNNLARQVVTVANTHQIPPSPEGLDFEQVSSVFHSHTATDPVKGVPGQRVQFVIVAPSRRDLALRELSSVPRDPQFYGEHAREWAPYRPSLDSPVADFALSIAMEREFQAVVTDLTDVVERLDQAGASNQIIVLLVDLWSTRLAEHRRALLRFDQADPRSPGQLAAVMVPANYDDQQTQAHLSELLDALRRCFVRRSGQSHDVTFRASILSPQAFDADLRVVLERSRNRIFSTGTVYRRPPGRAGTRPILRGP
jgi:FxsC-like protein